MSQNDAIITVRMDGSQCHVAMPDDWLKTKVYVNRRVIVLTQPTKSSGTKQRRPWESETSHLCDFPLTLQETFRIDTYDGEGECQLLSTEYMLTDEGLVLKKEYLGGRGVQVTIER